MEESAYCARLVATTRGKIETENRRICWTLTVGVQPNDQTSFKAPGGAKGAYGAALPKILTQSEAVMSSSVVQTELIYLHSPTIYDRNTFIL